MTYEVRNGNERVWHDVRRQMNKAYVATTRVLSNIEELSFDGHGDVDATSDAEQVQDLADLADTTNASLMAVRRRLRRQMYRINRGIE
jgi:type V secretory pathway adhesin AidA